MSGKKGEITLIVPGRETWELWTVKPGAEAEQALVSDVTEVNALKEIPLGETVLFFPLSQLTFAPFTIETEDSSLFDDLVSSHWEQLGIRLSPDDGILTDYSTVNLGDNATLLAPFALSPQTEHDLPARLPAHFDISPHAYPQKNDILIISKELGKWGMTFYRDGKIFFASTLGESLDEEAIRGARMSLLQLQLQNCSPSEYQVELWNEEEIPSVSKLLGMPVITKKPLPPKLPLVWSRILPADVHAERRKKANRQRVKYMAIAGIIVYVCLILYFYKGIVVLQKDIAALKKENETLSEPYDTLEDLRARWALLAPAIDVNLWPEDILFRCYRARSADTVKFDNFEIKTDEATCYPETILIKGTAPTTELITKFGQRLKSAAYKLDSWDWTLPSPEVSTKDKEIWSFNYQADFMEAPSTEG